MSVTDIYQGLILEAPPANKPFSWICSAIDQSLGLKRNTGDLTQAAWRSGQIDG